MYVYKKILPTSIVRLEIDRECTYLRKMNSNQDRIHCLEDHKGFNHLQNLNLMVIYLE